MNLGKVIVSFVVCIFCNIILNSFDVYSDIALTIKTLTFNLGDSILLSGCKVCHGKDDKDVFSVKNNSCQQCVTLNYFMQCGRSFQILDKINELEKRDTCEYERFGVRFNSTSKSFNWKNESCSDDSDSCCVENTQQPKIKHPLDAIDKRILAFQIKGLKNIRDDLNYDVYNLNGQLSYRYCEKVYYNYFNWQALNIKPFLKTNVTNNENQNQTEWFFKFTTTSENKTVLEKEFDFNDDCGIFIIEKQKNHVQNNGETCNSDACLVHFQYLTLKQNISNLEQWKENIFYDEGVKFGGKSCAILHQYGLISLVPIILNFIFHVLLFIDDLKFDRAYKTEVIFVFGQFYPQWKTIKFLYNYIKDKNETRFNEAKENFDTQVGSLEPFIESAVQVSLRFDKKLSIWKLFDLRLAKLLCLLNIFNLFIHDVVKVHVAFAITSAIEGFYPQNSAGYTITSFTDLNQVLPLISLVISLCASSFGMTKFFLHGPISIVPKDSLANGLISIPFLCMLLINLMFGIRVISLENTFFSSYRYERRYICKRLLAF